MKIIPIDTNSLDKHTAIACTENYYLMVLKYFKFPVESLFFDSYLSFHIVIKDYVEKRLPYLSYEKYNRVVDAGEIIGALGYSELHMNYENMLQCAEENNKEGIPIFVSVDALKLPRAGALPWIDKHYVMLNGMENNMYSIIDDYPRRSFFLTKEELKEIYQGEIYLLKKTKIIEKKKYIKKSIDAVKKIITQAIEKNFKEKFCLYLVNENILFLRDGIAFVRVSRKQLYHWVLYIEEEFNANMDELKEKLIKQYEQLNRMYLFFEIFRSRNTIDKNMIMKVFDEIYRLEYEIIDDFKKLLTILQEGTMNE